MSISDYQRWFIPKLMPCGGEHDGSGHRMSDSQSRKPGFVYPLIPFGHVRSLHDASVHACSCRVGVSMLRMSQTTTQTNLPRHK